MKIRKSQAIRSPYISVSSSSSGKRSERINSTVKWEKVMKKALVWRLQTAQKSHSENANEVHIVNYHWASPPPCQGTGSQSLSRWVCWPTHHKPWVNTREFTGAHRAGDDKSLGLGDAERKRDLYILFSAHGAVVARTVCSFTLSLLQQLHGLPMHQAKT